MPDGYTIRASKLQQLSFDTVLYWSLLRHRFAYSIDYDRVQQIASTALTCSLIALSTWGAVRLASATPSTAPAATGTTRPAPLAAAATTAASNSSPATPIAYRPAALAASRPLSLQIPAVGIDAEVTTVGLHEDDSLQVPDGTVTGWYDGSPSPGEIGPAVIVGHVDSPAGPAVFWRLREVVAGDIVSFNREDGSTVRFTVEKVEAYSQSDFPSQHVYGNIDYPGLRLITCDGEFYPFTGHYSDNLVVYARVVL